MAAGLFRLVRHLGEFTHTASVVRHPAGGADKATHRFAADSAAHLEPVFGVGRDVDVIAATHFQKKLSAVRLDEAEVAAAGEYVAYLVVR